MDAVTQRKVLSWEGNCGAEPAFPPEPRAMTNGRGNVDKIFIEGGKGPMLPLIVGAGMILAMIS